MSIPEKDIREFELLVEIDLRPLVHRRHAELERARAVRKDIESLQLQIEVLANGQPTGKPLKAFVDVGAGFRMHGRIQPPQTVAVDVGCGIFVELLLDEAKAYCAGRLTSLAQLIGILEAEVQRTSTDLAIAESGLKELHGMGQTAGDSEVTS